MFGLTSNALDTVHAPQILEALAKYKIRLVSFAPDDLSFRLSRLVWRQLRVTPCSLRPGVHVVLVLVAVVCWVSGDM